jgi:hypothetical protein
VNRTASIGRVSQAITKCAQAQAPTYHTIDVADPTNLERSGFEELLPCVEPTGKTLCTDRYMALAFGLLWCLSMDKADVGGISAWTPVAGAQGRFDAGSVR